MEYIKLKANAKLNLFLQINYINKQNYHDMTMINQSISLYDEISIKKTNKNQINIINDTSKINKTDNIIYKASKLIDEFVHHISVDISIKKNIPMQAGLGGGSSDAAAIILGLDRLYSLNISDEQKIKLALKLGADVPFCLFGNSKYVKGIGEKIYDIFSDVFLFIIIKPDENMPTKEAFELYDKKYRTDLTLDEKNKEKFKDNIILDNIKNKSQKLNIEYIKKYFYNDFEKVLREKFDIIDEIKKDFYENKASFTMMSGSGTTVYAIFNDDDTRKKAYEKLKTKYKNIFLSKTVNKGVEILDLSR